MSYVGPAAAVRLFASDNLVRIGLKATVRQIAEQLTAQGVGALVVIDDDQIHGVVSERDVVLAIAAGKDLDSTLAGDLDNRVVVTCGPDTSVHAAALLMMEHYLRHLVVVDEHGPVRMISARDLLGAYATN